ncbi:MAG TPA: hypothetical protein PKN80_06125 [bacterium]|uniref:Glycoside hydrolase family 42 N-terminal domain-containing protein n=1 Tax=candidate division TA06 bacterium ADurb.Bin417 TaxID=1852828 RepID=A0A1V5MJC7_UNCT6|nr:MAG: hypothetical protein BWY73_00422 [candidate division TA06 bacterium ADurb.Bin417]HNQ35625.1 hypothetical protein [bacterium]HNS48205.1 hypothetical protein [bacterium]
MSLRLFLPIALILFSLACLRPRPAAAHWEVQADDLPAWGQRGRLTWAYHDSNPTTPEMARWPLVTHLHGPRPVTGAIVNERVRQGIPINLRLEAIMFFGTDSIVRRQLDVYKGNRYRVDHDWYWQFNWFSRDPKFREAATVLRDGRLMVEYLGNNLTEREMGNPLSPMLLRMREEQSRAILGRHDPASPANPVYPQFPYTPENDDVSFGKKGAPYAYYPSFGYISSVWYDNPQLWADASEFSQRVWKGHFKEKFGLEIADPASHPSELVRREWRRFWADAYGRYFEQYRNFHQENIRNSAPEIIPLTTALNGRRVCPVMLNASKLSHIWGANQLYIFNRYRASDYPGVQCEFEERFTGGRHALPIKFGMASMHGRPTGKHGTNARAEGEALALNGNHSYVGLKAGTRAFEYADFQYNNGFLLENAQPANRIAILYNIRSGLVASNLIDAFNLGRQLDELGLPYDVLIEDDLSDARTALVAGYAAVLVPGGEFNAGEVAGFQRYLAGGGRLVLIGDAILEPPQYRLISPEESGADPWRPDQPLAGALGAAGFGEARVKSGRGELAVFDDQVVSNAKLNAALAPCLASTFRLPESRGGLVMANVLRQPRQGDALVIGLVNYGGQVQKEVKIALPSDLRAADCAVISPDGYAGRLKVSRGVITVPELYQYSAVVLGSRAVVEKALASVAPKLEGLMKLREPLKPAAGPKDSPSEAQLRPEAVDPGRRLARLRHGSNESNLAVCLDAVAPRRVKAGAPVPVNLKMILPGTHGTAGTTLEYWRLQAVNIETGRPVLSQPLGAPAPIEGFPVYLVRDGKREAMPYRAAELAGQELAAEVFFSEPGRYQLFVDFLYNVGGPDFAFTQGDAGPRVEPAFPGDRPAAGWGYPGRPLKKHYVNLKLPRMVVEVSR